MSEGESTNMQPERVILDQPEISRIIFENKYRVPQNAPERYFMRCIDGRYPEEEDLPAFAVAGATFGVAAYSLASANENGFELEPEKLFSAIDSLLGGKENETYHTHCGHRNAISEKKGDVYSNLGDFSLTAEQVDFLNQKTDQAIKVGATEFPLNGPHLEGAAIRLRGDYSIYPGSTDETDRTLQLFVFHDGLTTEFNHKLAEELLAEGAIKEGGNILDQDSVERIQTFLNNAAENHFYAIAKKLAPNLSLYDVEFDSDGNFKVVKTA